MVNYVNLAHITPGLLYINLKLSKSAMIALQVSFYQTFTGHEKLTNIKLSIKIPFQPVHWRLQLYWWPYLCKTMHRNVETETPCQWKMTRSTCNIGPITGSMYKYCKLRGSRRALWIAFNHVHLCQIKTIFVWKCHLCKSLFVYSEDTSKIFFIIKIPQHEQV